MNSFRKWLFRPKKTDTSLLAQFYHADDELNLIAAELDSFDGRKDPERCTMLVNQLRVCQDRVLNVIQKVMEDAIPGQRANRDFRVKFPDDVLQDSLAGQLWFGAECLAAGSSILNREVESASMRPLARALTKNLDSLRVLLRDQCLRSSSEYSDRIKEALVIFDKLFAEFELSYVSAMVPVKTMKEYDMLQEVTVLFSETVQRALKEDLLSQDMIDYCDPALMFTIPRLAIVCGLLIYPEGPLNPDMEPTNMTEMYRPFLTLLHKIRELLYTLSESELALLEKALCSSEEPEVATHRSMASQSDLSVASQSDSSFQVDQGFHEGGESIVQVDTFRSNSLVPVAESPVTPLNLNSCMHYLDLSPLSPASTLVEDLSHSGIDDSCLNKSESQDSGLHSENISTPDTVIIDSPSLTLHDVTSNTVIAGCPPLVSHDVEAQSDGTCVTSDKSTQIDDQSIVEVETDMFCLRMSDTTLCDNINNCDRLSDMHCCYSRSVENISELCREIVEEVVINAVHSSTGANNMLSDLTCDNQTLASQGNRDANVTSPSALTNNSGPVKDPLTEVADDVSGRPEVLRQFSWHYNVQFACPQLPLSRRDRERNSSGSFSSESTISDSEFNNESMTDFVVETLANINNPANYSDKSTSTKPGAHVGAPCVSEQNACAQSSDFTNSLYKLSSSNTKLLTDQSSLSYTNDCLLPNTLQPLTSNVPNTAEKVKKLKKVKHECVQNITCRIGNHVELTSNCNMETDCTPQVMSLHQLEEDSVSSSGSSCPSSDSECETNCSCAGSETSSYNSENNDVEEIALAIEAAETASRNEARARFRSSSDLIHRLFVCVAGVADQLQTNYASDLRHILKCVFELNASVTDQSDDKTKSDVIGINISDQDQEVQNQQLPSNQQAPSNQPSQSDQSAASNRMTHEHINPQISRNRTSPSSSSRRIPHEPPEWVPDDEVEICTACKIPFTFVRRRHHCRNCGKIFCGKCSSTTVPLPQYGHRKPVRVCHRCFIYQISHFTVTRDF